MEEILNNWLQEKPKDKFDKELHKYTYYDLMEFAEHYHAVQLQQTGVMRSAFAIIPDSEKLGIGNNKIIAVFKYREQAERFAKSLWEKYYIIEEVDSEHFS